LGLEILKEIKGGFMETLQRQFVAKKDVTATKFKIYRKISHRQTKVSSCHSIASVW